MELQKLTLSPEQAEAVFNSFFSTQSSLFEDTVDMESSWKGEIEKLEEMIETGSGYRMFRNGSYKRKIRDYCLNKIKNLRESGLGNLQLGFSGYYKNGKPKMFGITADEMAQEIVANYDFLSNEAQQHWKNRIRKEINEMCKKGFPLWTAKEFTGYILASCKEEFEVIKQSLNAPHIGKTSKEIKNERLNEQIAIAPTSAEAKGNLKVENILLIEEVMGKKKKFAN